ncbi:MAG: (2Fe-2S)-binding protein [Deltaproteobacteria bacterium]|nr:(2Fe-2S)-binding protein [Deltaproteobacteria bacterium]
MIKMTVNNEEYEIDVDGDKPLLWVLREDIGFIDTKYGCGIGNCGTCRVDVDGELTKSCLTKISSVEGKSVTTLVGLKDEASQAVKDAWVSEEASQCGFCQPGQVVTAAHLLRSNANPSDGDIDEAMDGICRCGAYQRMHRAVRKASDNLSSK